MLVANFEGYMVFALCLKRRQHKKPMFKVHEARAQIDPNPRSLEPFPLSSGIPWISRPRINRINPYSGFLHKLFFRRHMACF